jgi:flagellar hook protein FlgE
MSISSSLNAGVSGLNVNSSKLATIADNIANSGTYGYKRADTDFSSLVIAQRKGSYSAGGVRVSAFRHVDQQGTLVATTNSTDLAISGRGFLPVTTAAAIGSPDGSFPLQLVTTGSFRPDDEGYLRTESDLVLMGWPADPDGSIPTQPRDSAAGLQPVVVNRNQFAASPTTEMTLGANLPAEATQAGATGTPLELPVEYFDTVGASQTLVATFTPTVPATGQSNTWTLELTDMSTGGTGTLIGEFSIEFDTAAATGGSILAVTDLGTGTYSATTGELSVTLPGGPLTIGIGVPGDSSFLTQLSAEFAPVAITKNGARVGTLSGVEVDVNGFVIATYDTGFTRVIYQIPVADVPNANGLNAEDNQAFTISADSGPLYLWNAGEGPTGEMSGYAREESTTDIAAELTQLIQTQRAYSSNAKIIQTVDEMLQETTNIKR